MVDIHTLGMLVDAATNCKEDPVKRQLGQGVVGVLQKSLSEEFEKLAEEMSARESQHQFRLIKQSLAHLENLFSDNKELDTSEHLDAQIFAEFLFRYIPDLFDLLSDS